MKAASYETWKILLNFHTWTFGFVLLLDILNCDWDDLFSKMYINLFVQ